MNRRELLGAAPAVLVAGAACAAGAAVLPEPVSDDLPFLTWANHDGHDVLALCYPKYRIDYAFCYLLTSGRTIYAEGKRVNTGSGWRLADPGEFDGRIMGRVVSFHLRTRSRWAEAGKDGMW